MMHRSNDLNLLPRIRKHVLVALEEAGEDDLCALVNTINARIGTAVPLECARSVVKELIAGGILQLAQNRITDLRRWSPMPTDDAEALVMTLERLMRWDSDAQMWRWNPQQPRTQVLLTPLGQEVATRSLTHADP